MSRRTGSPVKAHITKAAAVAAMALGMAVATAGSASANSNFAAQIGPSGSGCFAWSTYGNGYVTGHVYSQNGAWCGVWITQYYNANTPTAETQGAGTVANTVPYYYGGPETDRVIGVNLSMGRSLGDTAQSDLYAG
jgi:hypothetical protein